MISFRLANFEWRSLGRGEGENEMRVLIVIEQSPKQRFLVTLHTKEIAEEVKDLVRRKRHSQAMATAFSRGRLEREVLHHEVSGLKVDLILSGETANWDLMK
ncbi:MAG: hypothetical protein WC515_06855 [Candidatus Omnitrophota bacterium]